MKNKTTNPYGIKTPTSVKEFRENLRKYYLCNTTVDGYEKIEKNKLMLDVEMRGIELNKISSFRDIYKITKTGFFGDGSSPSLIPKITQKKDMLEYMDETDQVLSSDGYFYDEKNYTLWEGKEKHSEFLRNGNPLQYTLDNQHLREFYMITLGDYSGYVYKDLTLYIYVRDSKNNMKSLDTQKKKGIEYSNNLGVDYSIINDELLGEYTLMDWIINNPNTNMYVVGLDRISRNRITLQNHLDLMSKNSLTLFTENGNYFMSKDYIREELSRIMRNGIVE